MLDKHPGIEMSSVKEPHYLARRGLDGRLPDVVSDRVRYESLWTGDPSLLRAEASVLYLLFAEEVMRTIRREFDGQPRVVVSLRNPIDRARSSYLDVRLKNPMEQAPTFEAAVAREICRGP